MLAREIDERVEPRMQAILEDKRSQEDRWPRLRERKEEPTPPALAAQLNRDFIAKGLLDYDGADWQGQARQGSTPTR